MLRWSLNVFVHCTLVGRGLFVFPHLTFATVETIFNKASQRACGKNLGFRSGTPYRTLDPRAGWSGSTKKGMKIIHMKTKVLYYSNKFLLQEYNTTLFSEHVIFVETSFDRFNFRNWLGASIIEAQLERNPVILFLKEWKFSDSQLITGYVHKVSCIL